MTDGYMERLDKLLAASGAGSRSEVKNMLRAGRVKVNGTVVKDGQYKAEEGAEILLDGHPVNTEKYRYFMLNKPVGLVSSTQEEAGGAGTVTDLFRSEKIRGLFPVGRLDKDTTGLLIITNDGPLGHILTAPSHHVDKCYEATVKGILTESAVESFAAGFAFKDFTSKPARLEILETDVVNGISRARVTVSEGKFHQVKRMFLKVDCEVTALKRLSMGSLRLDETLEEGKYRPLTESELATLKMEAGAD